ncbi:AAA family ATPase [Fusobacterium nucleatum]|uniref:AAA family ATPase n=1 Tax=Fusobacterium nucleatum TaxID=851 RepID=UPI00235E9649|nr:AAA family ATPase [Fusobacterium nucleatum]WDD88587.1 AAA family ATPase [Fusobacterium nucleatum]
MYDNEFFENKVNIRENKTNIEYINIIGLFGRYDVKVSLDNQVNIFIGENGLGKTTILNCVYYILENKYLKLLKIKFSEIQVKFKNNETLYMVSIEDIEDYKNRKRIYPLEIFETNELGDNFKSNKESINSLLKSEKLTYQYNGKLKKGNFKNVLKLEKIISSNIKQKIIYLPTYRRIESEFKSFRKKNNFGRFELYESEFESESEELLIKFGMSDVEEAIDRILEEIRFIAMIGFSKMTGILLKQYVEDSNSEGFLNLKKRPKVDYQTLEIILTRLGKEIEEEYRKQILSLFKDGKMETNKYLWNLIEKLIDNYNQQKQYDDRIKKFTDTCNKYLNDKQFYYNQSTLSLEIFLISDTKERKGSIKLANLSSGEKQIISLFSKLYLENKGNKKNIIIIDEPELSLSLKWQKMLLPDIINTGNCDLLITVTHSPFIFENEFDNYAKEIRRNIK